MLGLFNINLLPWFADIVSTSDRNITFFYKWDKIIELIYVIAIMDVHNS